MPNFLASDENGFTLDIHALPSAKERYGLMIQTFIPRPIAWVLTENENGSHNLAPFSYTMGVAANPMIFAFSCGQRRGEPGRTKKDTRRNLERTQKCVLHIPSVADIEAVNNSASGLEFGTSETETFGIETTSFAGFPLPRVKNAPIAFGCTFKSVTEVGTPPLGLILVEATHIFMAKHTVKEHENGLVLDPKAINPLSRLGQTKYGTLGDVLDVGSAP